MVRLFGSFLIGIFMFFALMPQVHAEMWVRFGDAPGGAYSELDCHSWQKTGSDAIERNEWTTNAVWTRTFIPAKNMVTYLHYRFIRDIPTKKTIFLVDEGIVYRMSDDKLLFRERNTSAEYITAPEGTMAGNLCSPWIAFICP